MMSTMQWIMLFCFPVFFLIPVWLGHQPVNFNNLSGFNFAFFFPAMIVIGQWYQQHPMWGMELLRPATRNRYLQVSGLTLAMWTALAWAMQILCWIIVAALIATGVNRPRMWISIAVSAATQCLLFAVGVWVMRYRSIALWMAGLVATIIFTSVIASHATFVNTPTTALWIACGVVIVSLAIMYDAYRRWLNTELG
jgi:hypothetical protein